MKRLRKLSAVTAIIAAILCLGYSQLFAASDVVNDRDLADARATIDTLVASEEKTKLFCDWHKVQRRLVRALDNGGASWPEVKTLMDASQAAYARLGSAFEKAHRTASLAYFIKNAGSQALSDAWSALPGKCAPERAP